MQCTSYFYDVQFVRKLFKLELDFARSRSLVKIKLSWQVLFYSVNIYSYLNSFSIFADEACGQTDLQSQHPRLAFTLFILCKEKTCLLRNLSVITSKTKIILYYVYYFYEEGELSIYFLPSQVNVLSLVQFTTVTINLSYNAKTEFQKNLWHAVYSVTL
jgi:hypothetical protein